MNEVLLRGHLGLGDSLICNGLVRHLVQRGMRVAVPAKKQFKASVSWMFRDEPAVMVFSVDDDEQCDAVCASAEERGFTVLRIGKYGDGWSGQWDQCFYRQAGVPWEERWNGFKFERDNLQFFEPPPEPYAFCHWDDERRIDESRLPALKICRPLPGESNNIFTWAKLIEHATEIHVIDSCFLNLAESIRVLRASRYVIHAYAKHSVLPTLWRQWEVLH